MWPSCVSDLRCVSKAPLFSTCCMITNNSIFLISFMYCMLTSRPRPPAHLKLILLPASLASCRKQLSEKATELQNYTSDPRLVFASDPTNLKWHEFWMMREMKNLPHAVWVQKALTHNHEWVCFSFLVCFFCPSQKFKVLLLNWRGVCSGQGARRGVMRATVCVCAQGESPQDTTPTLRALRCPSTARVVW